ncbi:MAG: Flp family type IVb pilin [Syntrophomonas sp.]
MKLVKRLIREEEGQGMIEYVLIVAFISIVAILAITGVGNKVKDIWTNTNTAIQNAAAPTS